MAAPAGSSACRPSKGGEVRQGRGHRRHPRLPGQLSELRDLPPPAEVLAEGARVTSAAGDLGQRAGAGQDRVDRGGRGLLRAENLPDAHHGVFGEGRHGLLIGSTGSMPAL
jgi:hypothetical protein